jgi:hypothetical protein
MLVLALAVPLFGCGLSRGELSGQVFIVTKGGQNFKLGLVTVEGFSAEKMGPYGKRMKEENDIRQKSLAELKARIDASKDPAEVGQFFEELKKLSSVLNRDGLGEHLITELPPADFTAKTDADGRFTMALPRQGRFALAAQASREAGGTTERYYWLIWVSLDGNARREIMLSNDNLVGMGSEDAYLKIKMES